MSKKKVPKSSAIYVCDICDYSTSRKSQYDRHLATDKHNINVLAINGNAPAIVKVPNDYTCTLCKKTYKDPSGLWRHNKKCHLVAHTSVSEEKIILKIEFPKSINDEGNKIK